MLKFEYYKEVYYVYYYHTCLDCGANLDPGEKCDCQNNQTNDILNITEEAKQLYKTFNSKRRLIFMKHNEQEPNLYDDVRHINNDIYGTVISKYPKEPVNKKSENLLDIQGANNKIYYGTPAKNWKIVNKYEP